MSTIDAYASLPHYFDHIAPVWHALPLSARGTFYASPRLASHAASHNIPIKQGRPPSRLDTHVPVITAAYSDFRILRPRPIVLIEHGAGQVYLGCDSGSYSGGEDRGSVRLFICPNPTVAQRNLDRYPTAHAIICGSPRLDQFHPPAPKPRSSPPTVAITFHADVSITPETRSSFRHFYRHIPLLIDAGYNVLAHAHPRLYNRVVRLYDRLGIPHTPDPDEVFAKADVLCADNTSLLFEFATLRRPLVFLTPPWYRRDVHHGLRFWDAVSLYPEVTDPATWPDAVAQALAPIPPALASSRDTFLHSVYTYQDGKASERAAAAIGELLEEMSCAPASL